MIHLIIISDSNKRIEDGLRYLNLNLNNKSIIKLVDEMDYEKLRGLEIRKDVLIAEIGFNKYSEMFRNFILSRMR